MIGEKIDGFVIVRKLAEGGMGVVYVAEHARFPDTRRVIKVLRPEFSEKHEFRVRFEREAQAASRLDHENILELDSFGSLPTGQLWIRVPYLIGRPLSEYLHTQGRLPEHRALVLMLYLLSALEHAHRANVVHRDLKPENIFLCPTDKEPLRIKLLDFGIAKLLDTYDHASTKAGSTFGTPGYMAVEQYEDANRVSPRSDLYSAAIIAYQLVTGELPWGPVSQGGNVLYYRQRTQVPDLVGVSRRWRAVLGQALTAFPERRWESARAMALSLAGDNQEIVRSTAPDLLRDSTPRVFHSRHDAVTLGRRAPDPLPVLHDDYTSTTTTGRVAMEVITLPDPPPSPSPRRLLLLGFLVCLLAGTTTFTVVQVHRGATSQPASAPPPPPPPSDAGVDALDKPAS